MKKMSYFLFFAVLFLELHSIDSVLTSEEDRVRMYVEYLKKKNVKVENQKKQNEKETLNQLRSSLQNFSGGPRGVISVRTISVLNLCANSMLWAIRTASIYSDSSDIQKEVSICQSYLDMLKTLKVISNKSEKNYT